MFDEAIERIIKTGFHIHPPLIDAVRNRLNIPRLLTHRLT
jgi:hypothetical protein